MTSHTHTCWHRILLKRPLLCPLRFVLSVHFPPQHQVTPVAASDRSALTGRFWDQAQLASSPPLKQTEPKRRGRRSEGAKWGMVGCLLDMVRVGGGFIEFAENPPITASFQWEHWRVTALSSRRGSRRQLRSSAAFKRVAIPPENMMRPKIRGIYTTLATYCSSTIKSSRVS